MEPWRDELYHHGILGQKWGVRRFQNPDGTRTALGKKRYSSNDLSSEAAEKKAKRKETAKKIAKGVAIGAGVAAAGYGAYKLRKHIKGSSKPFTSERLKAMGIDAAEPERIKIDTNQRTMNISVNEFIALARGKSTPSLDRKINKMAEEIKNDTTSNITKGTLASMRNETKKNVAKSLGTDESLKKAVNSLDDDTMALLKKYNFPTPGLSSTNGSKKVSDVSKSLDDLDSYTQDLLKRQRRGTASLGKAVKLADMTMDDLRKLDLW